MPYGDSECKTFYSQLILPAVISGLLIVPCVLAYLLRGNSTLPPLLAVAAIDVVFLLFFFWRVRFERDFAVIWYCTVFSSRIDYAEVSGMQCLYTRRPGAPSGIEFQLKNGRAKRWSLNLFSETVCREIVQEMESRLNLSSLPDPSASFARTMLLPLALCLFLTGAILRPLQDHGIRSAWQRDTLFRTGVWFSTVEDRMRNYLIDNLTAFFQEKKP